MSASTSPSIRLGIARLVMRTLGLGAYTFGAMTGSTYARFVGLRAAAERALTRGDHADADILATELLRLAERYSTDWNYGNAVHHGNIIRGCAALRAGDVAAAEAFLIAAGRTPGSPQLNSFGPNMQLASELLAAGSREPVLEYFEACKGFWRMEQVAASGGRRSASDLLDSWAADVRAGGSPDFGANLVY